MTNDLEQQVQTLRMQLHQEEDLPGLLTLLTDIEVLTAEHPVKNAYDLLEHAYYVLREATSDAPEVARDIILQRLLPWLIAPDQPERAGIPRGSSRDTLSEWFNQYPVAALHKLVPSSFGTLL